MRTNKLLVMLAAPLISGCSFATLDDDRSFLMENQRHTTADGGVTRSQLTQQLVAVFPESGEALIAIGDERTSDAERLLIASADRASETGIGSVDQTIGWAVGGLLGLIGTGLGVSNKLGKSRFVKLIESFDQKKKGEALAAAIANVTNGPTT